MVQRTTKPPERRWSIPPAMAAS